MTYTGPDEPTRAMIRQRCREHCELCALWAVGAQIHHRRPRGMGGSTHPGINSASNLAYLCWDCHRFIETISRRSAYVYGWLVPMNTDPAHHPFLLWGRWVYFDDHGGYAPADVPDNLESELF